MSSTSSALCSSRSSPRASWWPLLCRQSAGSDRTLIPTCPRIGQREAKRTATDEDEGILHGESVLWDADAASLIRSVLTMNGVSHLWRKWTACKIHYLYATTKAQLLLECNCYVSHGRAPTSRVDGQIVEGNTRTTEKTTTASLCPSVHVSALDITFLVYRPTANKIDDSLACETQVS